MSQEKCILTTKDFTILEVMFDRCHGRDDPLRQLVQRKLDSATVMFREDLPEDVASLSSRISFRVNGGATDSRILTHDKAPGSVGLYLSVNCARGLALLGLTVGQEFSLPHGRGEDLLLLEEVLYQPEAARRRKARSEEAHARPRPPALKLVQGTLGQPFLARALTAGPDDPGPAAA